MSPARSAPISEVELIEFEDWILPRMPCAGRLHDTAHALLDLAWSRLPPRPPFPKRKLTLRRASVASTEPPSPVAAPATSSTSANRGDGQ